jgi:hypothetical protein
VMEGAGPEFAPLLSAGWGRDAIVLILSKLDLAALRAHLRRALKFNAQGKPGAAGAGFLGICWPGVLDQLLSNGSAGLTDSLLEGIDAIILEYAESPGQWQILARAPFADVLKELGLEVDPASPSDAKGRKKK